MIYVLEELFKQDKALNTAIFNLRVQRALSWYKQAIYMDAQPEFQLISLSIVWNAIYVKSEVDLEHYETELHDFLTMILMQDEAHKLTHTLFNVLDHEIALILQCPYTCAEYWLFKSEQIDLKQWQQIWNHQLSHNDTLVKNRDVQAVLSTLLERIAQLKQQILTGGQSYRSGMQQNILRAANKILIATMSVILEILIVHASAWQDLTPHYPALTMS